MKKRKAKKPKRERSGTLREYQFRQGAFKRTRVKGGPHDAEAMKESLQAATPRGRIASWKPHAKRLGAGLEHLQAAEALLDDRGNLKNRRWSGMNEFDLLMARAEAEINHAQIGKTLLPLASTGLKSKEGHQRGGYEAYARNAAWRRQRNREMQAEIDRLCLEKGKTFKSARTIVARQYSLHPDSLKRILKNPRN